MPLPQQNLQLAAERAFEAVARQGAEQLLWLGAQPLGDGWRVPVLNEPLDVDLRARQVTTAAGRQVGPHWRILTLRYLAAATRPQARKPETTFADLPAARTYADVYRRRTTGRLCATVGRDVAGLSAAARILGGRPATAGDAAFDFDVFPRVPLRLIWHAGDEEFPPSATILLPANIEAYFSAEDVVVLSECFVARLGGRPF